MRGTKLMVVCSVLAAGAASAQDSGGAVDAGTGGKWSVGAGAGITAASNNANNPRSFVPRASLEYMLGSDSALVLGAFGNFGVGFGNGSGSQLDGGLGGNFGLRKYLTGAGANRLSLHGLVNAGWRDAEGSASTIELGLGAGFAVDHQLSDGLVLRGVVDVANFGYSRNTGGQTSGNRIGLDLFLAPALELRFTF